MGGEAGQVVRVIGFTWSAEAHEVKDYLARNRVVYEWLDYESDPRARELVREAGREPRDLPLVCFPDGTVLTSPSDAAVADQIGLSTRADSPFYDLVVVGGGPAGLAAAVYAGSEGLRTVVIEREAPGGQAGMSASIENYLGFPEGLSGAQLAERAVRQAERFGVEIVAARAAIELRADGLYRSIALDDGTEIAGHSVLIATGVAWRTLEGPGCERLIGRGIYYGAAAAEAEACRDRDVYLVGGGNSAGQAAVLLSRYSRSVTLVAPEPDFGEQMSEYLLDRLRSTENVRFRSHSIVVGAEGESHLERIVVEDVRSGERETLPTGAVFVFIGAQPRTDWLAGVLERDDEGYLLAAQDLPRPDPGSGRAPLLHESSLRGVFLAGDVRSGSVKRIGAAVGEGSTVIQSIHRHLRNR